MSRLPSKMKALIKDKPEEGYELKEIDVPTPVGDEVLIMVEKVAICGSDIALYEWNSVARVIATVPFIPGHEATGVVVGCGPDATIPVGQRVAVENHFYCGECYTCKEGRGDICKKMNQYGHGRGTMHGGFSEYSIVSQKYCYQMKTAITANEAVLLEPMGVAFNGVEGIDVSGHDVLVLGAGPVGLLAAAVSKALGATRVIVADINPARLELATKLGADITINGSKVNLKEEVMKLTEGNGVARLVEATGALLNSCFELLRKGAKLALIGLPKGPLHVENALQEIVFKSITMKTVHGRKIFHTWEECEKLIADGKVDPNLIISHELPMSKWEEAFELLMSGNSCKIVVDPQA